MTDHDPQKPAATPKSTVPLSGRSGRRAPPTIDLPPEAVVEETAPIAGRERTVPEAGTGDAEGGSADPGEATADSASSSQDAPRAESSRAAAPLGVALIAALFGLVAGAVGGAVAAWWLQPAGDGSALSALEARIDREAAQTAKRADLEALTRRVTGLGGDVKANADKLAEALRQAPAQAPPSITAVDPAQLDALRGDIAALKTRIGELDPQAVAKAADLAGRVTALTRAVLAARLEEAVRAGAPYADLLSRLQAAGMAADQLAPLKAQANKGVPTTQTLRSEFAAIRPQLTALKGPSDAGLVDRLKASALKLVKVTPVGTEGGGDPASLAVTIDAALARGDTQAALAAWRKLPEDRRAPYAAFGDRLAARAAAEDAAALLATQTAQSLSQTGAGQ